MKQEILEQAKEISQKLARYRHARDVLKLSHVENVVFSVGAKEKYILNKEILPTSEIKKEYMRRLDTRIAQLENEFFNLQANGN